MRSTPTPRFSTIRGFWTEGVDADEAKGLTVRVGAFRCAPLNDKWICLRDGFDYPYSETFASRQEAVDFMVDRALAQHGYEVDRGGWTPPEGWPLA